MKMRRCPVCEDPVTFHFEGRDVTEKAIGCVAADAGGGSCSCPYYKDKASNTAEARFKRLVVSIIENGIYPSPTSINVRRDDHTRSLNGRECRWREEVLKSRGWTYRTGAVRYRWVPPWGTGPIIAEDTVRRIG